MSDTTQNQQYANAELEAISPKTIPVTLASGDVLVLPIKVKQLPAFTKAIVPLIANLVAGDSPLLMIADRAEDVIAAVAVGTGMDVDAINALDVDDLVKLASAVIEVNLDFFMRKVLPQVNLASERITKMTDGKTLLPV